MMDNGGHNSSAKALGMEEFHEVHCVQGAAALVGSNPLRSFFMQHTVISDFDVHVNFSSPGPLYILCGSYVVSMSVVLTSLFSVETGLVHQYSVGQVGSSPFGFQEFNSILNLLFGSYVHM